MLRFLPAFLVLLLGGNQLFAHACQPVNLITDAQKKGLLQDYIRECHRQHFFVEDKGAVKLIAYQDADGRPCWLLSAIVDDRYRTAPPASYTRFGNDVILVYQGDSNGNPLPIAGNLAEREACIREVLKGRLYHYTNEPQYTTTTDAQGNAKQVQITHVIGGNPHNDLLIKFNRDGTVSKFTPV
ncbi:MAG: hypothetical protein ACRYFK_18630 [Janthinobacterium lividum]